MDGWGVWMDEWLQRKQGEERASLQAGRGRSFGRLIGLLCSCVRKGKSACLSTPSLSISLEGRRQGGRLGSGN